MWISQSGFMLNDRSVGLVQLFVFDIIYTLSRLSHGDI